MAGHALYDGTCEVTVKYRCDEHDMEDNAQQKQVEDTAVSGRMGHFFDDEVQSQAHAHAVYQEFVTIARRLYSMNQRYSLIRFGLIHAIERPPNYSQQYYYANARFAHWGMRPVVKETKCLVTRAFVTNVRGLARNWARTG